MVCVCARARACVGAWCVCVVCVCVISLSIRYYSPEAYAELQRNGTFNAQREISLRQFLFDADMIVHEAGVPSAFSCPVCVCVCMYCARGYSFSVFMCMCGCCLRSLCVRVCVLVCGVMCVCLFMLISLPAIHTDIYDLNNLPASTKRKMWIVHTASIPPTIERTTPDGTHRYQHTTHHTHTHLLHSTYTTHIHAHTLCLRPLSRPKDHDPGHRSQNSQNGSDKHHLARCWRLLRGLCLRQPPLPLFLQRILLQKPHAAHPIRPLLALRGGLLPGPSRPCVCVCGASVCVCVCDCVSHFAS